MLHRGRRSSPRSASGLPVHPGAPPSFYRGERLQIAARARGLDLVAQDLTPVDLVERLVPAAGPDELADLEFQDCGIDGHNLKGQELEREGARGVGDSSAPGNVVVQRHADDGCRVVAEIEDLHARACAGFGGEDRIGFLVDEQERTRALGPAGDSDKVAASVVEELGCVVEDEGDIDARAITAILNTGYVPLVVSGPHDVRRHRVRGWG